MKTYQELKQLISEYQNKVQLRLCTIDYAKGYCMGVLSEQTSESISEDEYDQLSASVDDIFDISQSDVNIPMKPLWIYACSSAMNHSWYKYHCPVCGIQFGEINNLDKVERCPGCNQAIDWSGK